MSKISTDLTPSVASTMSGMASAASEAKANNLKNKKVTTEKEIDHAASGFEALLLQQMMQSMWSTVEFSGMFNEEGNEASIYRDMFNQAIADETTKGRGMGVKQYVKQQLTKGAEKGHGKAAKLPENLTDTE